MFSFSQCLAGGAAEESHVLASRAGSSQPSCDHLCSLTRKVSQSIHILDTYSTKEAQGGAPSLLYGRPYKASSTYYLTELSYEV